MYLRRLDALINGRALTAEGDAGAAAGGADGGSTAGSGPVGSAAVGGGAGVAATRLSLGGDTGGDDAGGEGGGGAAATGEFVWPENWQEVFAGDDAEARKIVERLTSPADIRKTLVNQAKAIRSARYKSAALPEDATEAEIAEYRKVAGVPDKPEGYGLEFPKEIPASDTDKQMLGEFAQHMNERHVPPAAAKAAFEFYTNRMAETRVAQAEAEREAILENIAELRKEYPGRLYKQNIEMAEDYLKDILFEGQTEEYQMIINARTPTGVKLAQYAPFVKKYVSEALKVADDGTTIAGDGAGGGTTIEEEYKALIKKSVDTPRDTTDRDHARMRELATVLARSEERRNQRSRAA